jgi:hypothetical protein
VTYSTYMMVCSNHKRKCLWRGRLMSWLCSVVTCTIYCYYSTLRSQDDDFHPHKTLNVHRMKFVIVHGSLSYRLILQDNYLYSLFQCFHQQSDHYSLRGISKVSLVLPMVSYLLCPCAREGLSNFSSCLFNCITTLGGRHCIVGFWVKDHWWLLGTQHVIRSCCQSHDLVSRSSITMINFILNSSIIFPWGFC